MIVIDNFLPDFDQFRAHLDAVDYHGLVNPADGIFYPGVSIDIPADVAAQVIEGIESAEGRPVNVKTMFLRLSVEGVDAPHQAHTDAIMGQRSMMLYVNRGEHCKGGTALVKHLEGLDRNPVSPDEEALWRRDTNNPQAWEVTRLCAMKPNRACMFDSFLMHRAEPVGGFGHDGTDGRLVLTSFYDYS